MQSLTLPDGELYFQASLDLGDSADHWLQTLIDTTPWREEDIRLFGKVYKQPRLIAWYGDPAASYTYSGKRYEPSPWTPALQTLRARVEQAADASFNSVLLNYYRDGADSMGMHSDDEPELGEQPVIASLSLGATRTLVFRHRQDRAQATRRVELPSGSLLVMAGTTQQHWKHGINKMRRPCGPRINLTFRRIVTA